MRNFLLFSIIFSVFLFFPLPTLSGGLIAVTFDDGPSLATTPRLLDILKKHGVKATFFLTGVNAERCPKIVCRIVREGHEVGNHTYCHFDLSRADAPALKWQISAAQEAIARITGFTPKIFRFPYSRINQAAVQEVSQAGMRIIRWNVSPADYENPSPGIIAERVLSAIKPGDIVVMHDYHQNTVAALRLILEGLKKKGLQAVTISELLGK